MHTYLSGTSTLSNSTSFSIPMHSISSIHSLIQSLTKTEKRYFKLNSDLQKGEKKYLALFELLEKHPVLDTSLRENLKSAFPGNSIEPARKHLYQILLKALRQFEAEKDTEARLGNMLQDSRILHKKGLYKLSMDALAKVKREAQVFEKLDYYILAARQELRFLAEKRFLGMDESELIHLQSMIRELIEQQVWINKHHTLHEILLFRYLKSGMVRSESQITHLNDLLLEEYQLLNRHGKPSFEARQLHLHFQSVYFRMTGNIAACLEVYHELDKLFQENQPLWEYSPELYIAILEGISSGLLFDRKEEEIPFFLNRMKKIRASNNLVQLSIPFIIAEIELKSLINKKLYQEGITKWNQLSEEFHAVSHNLPAQVHSQCMFTVARLYFLVRDYGKSLRIVNDELNKPAGLMDHYTRTNFLLFNLQINSLLDKMDYIHYALRSVERKLKTTRKLYNAEQLVITVLKKWLNYSSISKFSSKIEKLENNPYERQIIEELNLSEWLNRLTGPKVAN